MTGDLPELDLYDHVKVALTVIGALLLIAALATASMRGK